MENQSDINPANLTMEARGEIRKAIMEMDASMTRAEAEREHQKNIIAVLHGKFGVDKKIIRKMAKTYHAGNFPDVQMEQEEFEESYMNVMQTGV